MPMSLRICGHLLGPVLATRCRTPPAHRRHGRRAHARAQFLHDRALVERGLRNYWGYNSIAYLAPHNEYASYGGQGKQVFEFKQMVKTLHAHGSR